MRYISQLSRLTREELEDIGAIREALSLEAPVLIHRLLQCSLRDILARKYGQEAACGLLRTAGRLAGAEFAEKELDRSGYFGSFMASLANKLRERNLGLQVEQTGWNTLLLTLTAAETLNCSGLSMAQTAGEYDEGFLSGILEAWGGQAFHVEEIGCRAEEGSICCRFSVSVSLK